MKLFSKAKSIPKQPDYDIINAIERENRMHAEGFNERFDQMLIDEFNGADAKHGLKVREENVRELLASLYSVKYRIIVTNILYEARRKRWSAHQITRDENPYEALRARMVARGKNRHR